MNNETLSPDGAWRWDGERWIPNQPPSPPPPPPTPTSPTQAPSPAPGGLSHDVPMGASRDGLVVPALVAGGVALLPVLIRLGGDTIRAFGDRTATDQPWYFDTWFIVVQFLMGALALALASVAALRDPGRLSAVAMAIAGGVFLQGLVLLYYRVVVSYLGYDIPL